MRAMYEFRCEDGHTNERYTDSECTHIPCLDCNKIAKRIVSAVRSKLDPLSGDFMGATRQWEKKQSAETATRTQGQLLTKKPCIIHLHNENTHGV